MMSGVIVMLGVLTLKISIVLSAPLLELLQPYQRIAMQPMQQNLQQQLLELQTMQQLSPVSQFGMGQLQPLIILLPEQSLNMNLNNNPKINDHTENEMNNHKTKTKDEDDDLNSVIVDAEPIPILEEQKAYLLMPNGRFSIGEFISALPFFPIEINVPDTISWAYNGISNGISGIISIIGSRLPFRRPVEEPSMNNNINLKSMISEIKMRNNAKPFIIMPLGGFKRPILPFQN